MSILNTYITHCPCNPGFLQEFGDGSYGVGSMETTRTAVLQTQLAQGGFLCCHAGWGQWTAGQGSIRTAVQRRNGGPPPPGPLPQTTAAIVR